MQNYKAQINDLTATLNYIDKNKDSVVVFDATDTESLYDALKKRSTTTGLGSIGFVSHGQNGVILSSTGNYNFSGVAYTAAVADVFGKLKNENLITKPIILNECYSATQGLVRTGEYHFNIQSVSDVFASRGVDNISPVSKVQTFNTLSRVTPYIIGPQIGVGSSEQKRLQDLGVFYIYTAGKTDHAQPAIDLGEKEAANFTLTLRGSSSRLPNI